MAHNSFDAHWPLADDIPEKSRPKEQRPAAGRQTSFVTGRRVDLSTPPRASPLLISFAASLSLSGTWPLMDWSHRSGWLEKLKPLEVFRRQMRFSRAFIGQWQI